MYLLRFASFAWGLFNGYQREPLIAVLAVSVALVVVDIVVNRRQLFQGGGQKSVGSNFLIGLGIYFGAAFLSSLISQGFGYAVGWLVRRYI